MAIAAEARRSMMLWKERLVASSSVAMFALAGVLSLPDSGPVGSAKYVVYELVGVEQMLIESDPYRPVDASPEESSRLGKRYLAAVKPGNAAVDEFNVALATGKWPAVKAACQKAISPTGKTLALIKKGDPEWPRDLDTDMALLVIDIENDIASSEACAAASSLEAWMESTEDHVDSGAADRIRVRLGLAPRPQG